MTEPLRAIVVNEVPLWDAKVANILVELHEVFLDKQEEPEIRVKTITNLHGQLDLLVRKLERGKWSEGILAAPQLELEEWPRQPVPVKPAKPVTEFTAEDFLAYWDARIAEELDWWREPAR